MSINAIATYHPETGEQVASGPVPKALFTKLMQLCEESVTEAPPAEKLTPEASPVAVSPQPSACMIFVLPPQVKRGMTR